MPGGLVARYQKDVEPLYRVESKAGETLTQLSKRTDNQWSANLTALRNGLNANAKLLAGQRIKITHLVQHRSK